MKLSQFRFRLPEEQVALFPPHRTFKNEDGTEERIYSRDQSRLVAAINSLHRAVFVLERAVRRVKGYLLFRQSEFEL